MRATELITSSLTDSMNFAEQLLRDMEDQPFVRTCEGLGPHPYWLLGHLTVSEAATLDRDLLGRPNRYNSWEPRFAGGTIPAERVSDDPTYGELLEALGGVRAATLDFVGTLTDSDLDRPCHVHDGPGRKFDSVGSCLSGIGLHMGIHAGQVACARRACGRPPLFSFDSQN